MVVVVAVMAVVVVVVVAAAVVAVVVVVVVVPVVLLLVVVLASGSVRSGSSVSISSRVTVAVNVIGAPLWMDISPPAAVCWLGTARFHHYVLMLRTQIRKQ